MPENSAVRWRSPQLAPICQTYDFHATIQIFQAPA